MTRKFAFLTLVLLSATACTRSTASRQSLTGPSSQSADVIYDSSVRWDATQLGRVVIDNNGRTDLRLTLIVWKYFAELDQWAKGVSPQHVIKPGEIAHEITTGVPMECGSRYQRDVYEGGPYPKGVTLNEVPYPYAAPGVLWMTPPCGAPTPPRQPTCADEGLTVTKLPRVPGTLVAALIATFNIGPATVAWEDGPSNPIPSGVVASRLYVNGDVKHATVTTALGCSGTVWFVF